MTKEFHSCMFENSIYQQYYIFEVERDGETNDVGVLELWIVTTIDGKQIKTRINFDQVIDSITRNIGGNVLDHEVEGILDIFDVVLNKYKKQQLYIDLAKKELLETSNNDTELLINANNKADKHIERENKELSEIVKNMLSK